MLTLDWAALRTLGEGGMHTDKAGRRHTEVRVTGDRAWGGGGRWLSEGRCERAGDLAQSLKARPGPWPTLTRLPAAPCSRGKELTPSRRTGAPGDTSCHSCHCCRRSGVTGISTRGGVRDLRETGREGVQMDEGARLGQPAGPKMRHMVTSCGLSPAPKTGPHQRTHTSAAWPSLPQPVLICYFKPLRFGCSCGNSNERVSPFLPTLPRPVLHVENT